MNVKFFVILFVFLFGSKSGQNGRVIKQFYAESSAKFALNLIDAYPNSRQLTRMRLNDFSFFEFHQDDFNHPKMSEEDIVILKSRNIDIDTAAVPSYFLNFENLSEDDGRSKYIIRYSPVFRNYFFMYLFSKRNGCKAAFVCEVNSSCTRIESVTATSIICSSFLEH